MASSASKLSRQLKQVAQSWPTDPFRPNMQLSIFFTSLSMHPELPPEAVRAAQALRSGELQMMIPLSEKTLKPASKPEHFNRIVEAFQKSAQGIARPWWKRFFNVW